MGESLSFGAVGRHSIEQLSGGSVDKPLVRLSILDYQLRVAVDGQDQGTASFLELMQEVAGVSLKV
jgi:hypothetical protein